MKKNKISLFILCSLFSMGMNAQSFNWVSSKNAKFWQTSNVKLQGKSSSDPDLIVSNDEELLTFKSWGTTFNELGWDALNMLPKEKQDEIMSNLFSPSGELKFTLGRFSMNANDYAREWYSCNEVQGDFKLEYFNIDRDKTTLIPYIKLAQKYNPDLRFWMSPWSPPSWMKVNQYYSVVSNDKYNQMPQKCDILLFENKTNRNGKLFPRQLATNDYFIQDERYLKSYADYFCKFISAYKEENIPISMVMYQNEAYSYTAYPGCAWTPEGTIKFNAEYLAPALRKQHPEVELYLGTINTNRLDIIDQILSDHKLALAIKGVGFQWEGRQILPEIRKKYPQYKYVQTESECGGGTFDWRAAEHTFYLMSEYISNGCEEYTIWNSILADGGVSAWGWKQNALIHVDSKNGTATYTPEYFAVKHFSHYVDPGSKLLSYKSSGSDKKSIMVFKNSKGKHVVIAGNYNNEPQTLNVKIGNKYLNVKLEPRSLNTFIAK